MSVSDHENVERVIADELFRLSEFSEAEFITRYSLVETEARRTIWKAREILLREHGICFVPSETSGIFKRGDAGAKVRRAKRMRRTAMRKVARAMVTIESADVNELSEVEQRAVSIAKDRLGETLLTMKMLSRSRRLPPGL